ncbi:MAG: ergothioneine biosynthesis protein EgtC [Acidimicrobiia bacterium]
MCRHVAYLGPPIALDALVFSTPTALAGQARAPRFQPGIDDNPHGYGIGWYDADGGLQRHRSTTAIWDDPDLPPLAGSTRSGAFVAAARLASPGLPVEVSGNAPFTDGRWLFSLNGIVLGWHDGFGAVLRSRVSATRAQGIEGSADSEVLFALALDAVDAGATAAEALADVVGAVAPRSAGELNMVLADAEQVAATVWGHTLHARVDDGLTLASEPFDDGDDWDRLPDRTVVSGDQQGWRSTTLEIGVR